MAGEASATLPDWFIKAADARAPALVAFSVVRNERLRLGAWLRHYRGLGVKTFAIIDNGSTDGTDAALEGEPDVVLLRRADSYAAANFGMDWLNEFHRRITPGTWVLHADLDELVVYRGWPDASLPDLLARTASGGYSAVLGFLLDMYPNGVVDEARLTEGEDPFAVAPCFDGDYRFRPKPRKPWVAPGQVLEVVGGPRVRLLSSWEREAATTWFDYFARGQMDRLLPLCPDRLVRPLVRAMPKQMPALSKVPLALSGSGFRYVNSHDGADARYAPENVVTCHFKFLADFVDRVRYEATRGEHYRRGAEYIMYADAIAREGRLDLRYPGTRRFEGAEQFAELGLFRDLRATA